MAQDQRGYETAPNASCAFCGGTRVWWRPSDGAVRCDDCDRTPDESRNHERGFTGCCGAPITGNGYCAHCHQAVTVVGLPLRRTVQTFLLDAMERWQWYSARQDSGSRVKPGPVRQPIGEDKLKRYAALRTGGLAPRTAANKAGISKRRIDEVEDAFQAGDI